MLGGMKEYVAEVEQKQKLNIEKAKIIFGEAHVEKQLAGNPNIYQSYHFSEPYDIMSLEELKLQKEKESKEQASSKLKVENPIITKIVRKTPANEAQFVQLYDRGTILLNERKFNQALENFHEAIKIDNTDPELLGNTGITYVQLGNYDKGLKFLNHSLGYDDKNPIILLNKGLALATLTRYDEAIECFEKLLKFNPEFFQAK